MEESAYNENTFQALAAQLLTEDEDLCYEAAKQIQRMGRPVLASVIEWTNNPHPRLREMACYILGQSGHWLTGRYEYVSQFPEATPILVRLLASDPDAEVRAGAAFALSHQADIVSIPALVCAAADSSEEVRYGVAHALGSYYDFEEKAKGAEYKQDAEAALLLLMDDTDDDVRDWATFGIHQGDHDTPRARARLWKALDDPNPDVRGEAADGLAKFGDRSLIPRLTQLLRNDEPMSVCYFIAAEQLADPVLLPNVEAGAQRWREWLKKGEDMHPAILSALETLRGKVLYTDGEENV